jgi:hypothetical protein
MFNVFSKEAEEKYSSLCDQVAHYTLVEGNNALDSNRAVSEAVGLSKTEAKELWSYYTSRPSEYYQNFREKAHQ